MRRNPYSSQKRKEKKDFVSRSPCSPNPCLHANSPQGERDQEDGTFEGKCEPSGTAGPLHMNLQGANFHTYERVSGCSKGCQVWVKLQLASISYCWRSFHSTISLLQSVTLLTCSLNARSGMPAVVLYYCTFQGTVQQDLKCFLNCCAF